MDDVKKRVARPRLEEILDIATRLFAENGYAGASINDVAESAGIRKASFFHYFGSKEALYEAVLERLIARLREPLASIYAGRGSYTERLEAITATLVTTLGTQPYAARLLVRETMDWGPVIRGKLLGTILQVLEAGAAWVRAGQDSGEFVEGDAKQIILSALGVHLMPFALGNLVEHYAGTAASDPRFVVARREATCRQMRDLHLTKLAGRRP